MRYWTDIRRLARPSGSPTGRRSFRCLRTSQRDSRVGLRVILWVGLLVGRYGEKIRALEAGPLFSLSRHARWITLSTRATHLPVRPSAPLIFPITLEAGVGAGDVPTTLQIHSPTWPFALPHRVDMDMPAAFAGPAGHPHMKLRSRVRGCAIRFGDAIRHPHRQGPVCMRAA